MDDRVNIADKITHRVLLVEDNPSDAALLRAMLEEVASEQYETQWVTTASQAVDVALRQLFDVVLLDLSLPDSQGLETIQKLHAALPATPIVVLSGLSDEQVSMEAVQHGAQDYLVKGSASARSLARAIRYALDRKRAERALRQARDDLDLKVRLRTSELRHANQSLRMLGHCGEAIIHADDEPTLLQDICRLIVESGDYRLAWVGYAENDAPRSVRPVAYVGFEDGYLEASGISWADGPMGSGPTGLAIRTGTVQIGRDFENDPALAPWREEALRRGYRSSMAVPLTSAGRTFGALTVYSSAPEAFAPDDVELLQRLANDLAFGVNALRTRAERDMMVEALAEQQDRLGTLVRGAPLLIWATDTHGVVTLFDGRLRPQGLTADCVVGKPLAEVLPGHDEILDSFRRALQGEEVILEVPFGDRLYSSHCSPIRDTFSRITGVLCVSTDITPARRKDA
jgi:CheY-like chemotaxis protein/putative methionine-R-sulfoxide reductase with GAF domain